MRWLNRDTILKGKEGQKRTIKKFLLLPCCLPNKEEEDEWRWLETTSVIQTVTCSMGWGYKPTEYFWQNTQWED